MNHDWNGQDEVFLWVVMPCGFWDHAASHLTMKTEASQPRQIPCCLRT